MDAFNLSEKPCSLRTKVSSLILGPLQSLLSARHSSWSLHPHFTDEGTGTESFDNTPAACFTGAHTIHYCCDMAIPPEDPTRVLERQEWTWLTVEASAALRNRDDHLPCRSPESKSGQQRETELGISWARLFQQGAWPSAEVGGIQPRMEAFGLVEFLMLLLLLPLLFLLFFLLCPTPLSSMLVSKWWGASLQQLQSQEEL